MRVPDRKPKGVPNRAGNVPPRAAAGTLGALCFTAALLAPAAAGSALAATRPAAAAPALSVPLLTSTTSKSFSAAVSSLKTAVSSAGMMVLGELNQAGALSVAGLHLKGAESFFVGNPVVGKKFFQMNPAIGAVIPVHLYVFVNSSGRTELAYLDPSRLAGVVDPMLAKPAAMLAGAAAKIVRAVTGQAPSATATVRSLTFVTWTSPRSFSATVSSLKTAVSSAGMMVLGQLNQAGALSVAGLHLAGAESFYVGNPVVGKKFFQMNAIAGIEIPVGFYLWVDKAGKTEIGYFAPTPVLSGASAQLASGGPMFSKMAAKIADATA